MMSPRVNAWRQVVAKLLLGFCLCSAVWSTELLRLAHAADPQPACTPPVVNDAALLASNECHMFTEVCLDMGVYVFMGKEYGYHKGARYVCKRGALRRGAANCGPCVRECRSCNKHIACAQGLP